LAIEYLCLSLFKSLIKSFLLVHNPAPDTRPHGAPHIHRVYFHGEMGRHTVCGHASHAKITYVGLINSIRTPQGESNQVFHLPNQYYVSMIITELRISISKIIHRTSSIPQDLLPNISIIS
jgi:hypothetical protein